MPLRFVGLKNLSERQLDRLQEISSRSIGRIEREVPGANLIITIKKYEKEGKRSRIAMHAKINYPSIRFTAKADAWDIATVTHKIFDKLENEILHKQKD